MKKFLFHISLLIIFFSCNSQLYHSIYGSRSVPGKQYPNMLLVEGGTLDSSYFIGEKTAGGVMYANFYMSQFEITNEQYAFFLNQVRDSISFNTLTTYIFLDSTNGQFYLNTKKEFVVKKGYQKYPVTGVTFLGAESYTVWLTNTLEPHFEKKYNHLYDREMPSYRIPHEVEWYYASCERGKHYSYSGSDAAAEVAWYKGNSSTTQKAGKNRPNHYQLYDMSGNVAEWTYIDDRCNCDTYTGRRTRPEVNVVKGGSFLSDSLELKLRPIETHPQDSTRRDVGFRVVQIWLDKNAAQY